VGLVDNPAFIFEWNRGPGRGGAARRFVASGIALMANGSSHIGRSPGQRYRRDMDGPRCLRSNQCNGLDRFPGSAVSARKGITARDVVVRAPIPALAEPERELPLPPLLALTDTSTSTAELVLAINRLGAIHREPILASMYRHLAHWPAYLALVWTMLAPLGFDQRLDRAIEDAIAQARARARHLVAQFPSPLPAIRRATARGVARAIDRLTGDVIAKMVVICALLRRLTDS
jgi:hypothetical protein